MANQFGKYNLLSPEEYYKKIHAPEQYGALSRNPASEDDEEDTLPPDQENASLRTDDGEEVPPPEESPDEKVGDIPTSKVDPDALPLDIEAGEKNPDASTAKETNDADEYQKALAQFQIPEESAKTPSTQSQNPQLNRFQDYLAQYKQLQDQQRKGDLVNGLIAAGGKIGQSVAGKYSGNFTPDEAGNKMLAKMNERPMQGFEQGLAVEKAGYGLNAEAAANDPNSPQSRLVRQYLNQRMFKDNPLPDNVSAADAQMLLKSVGKPNTEKATNVPLVNQKTGEKTTGVWHPVQQMFTDLAGQPIGADWIRDYRAQSFVDAATGERLGFGGGTGKVTGPLTGPGVSRPVVGAPTEANAPIELNRSFLNVQQGKQVDHAREKFIKEVQDDRNSLNANDRVISVLKAGGELGDLPREIQDQLNRAFGQKGHISDAQLGGLLGKPDWRNRVENAVSLGMNGKLTDENRKFLLDVATLIKQQNESYINNKSQIYQTNLYNDLKSAPNLQKYKFGPESVRGLLGVESAVHPEGPPTKQDPKIVQWAKEHADGNYEAAKNHLVKKGYVPNEGASDQNSTDTYTAPETESQPSDEEEE